MDRVAGLSAQQRSDLFSETAAQRGMTPFIVEKDFWVTWTLGKLFAHPTLSRILMFKGGTSLSKVFGLIERFSEDIDLVLDWTVLTGEDPEAVRSKTKQQKFNDQINEQAQAYIASELLQHVSECIKPVCECAIDAKDSHVLNLQYPAAFSDEYFRPEVRLEIGPLASWLPYGEFSIRPYAAETFPAVFSRAECRVRAIKAERTFWEKATILHQEAHRPENKVQPSRYSRHYYDLARMAISPIKDIALQNYEILANVVEFKKTFYASGWASYDLATPGTLRLIPPAHVLKSVKADYRAMRTMIFGEYPAIEVIMTQLQALEDEINDLAL